MTLKYFQMGVTLCIYIIWGAEAQRGPQSPGPQEPRGAQKGPADKGTLDAIFITGKDIFREAVREMGRVTAAGGCVVSISRVIDPEVLFAAFDNPLWENVHDGGLAFAPDGEATIDLGAGLYSWRRTAIAFDEYVNCN